jgi:hypothetical protein
MLNIIMMILLKCFGKWVKKVFKISLKKLILSRNKVLLSLKWFLKEGKQIN